VLQEREVERVGGTRTIKLDIRVLATSNRDVQEEVAAGRFREDLFFRLNVFPLAVPALGERTEDILPLARKLLDKHANAVSKPRLTLGKDAERELTAYSWEGNIRELDNVMQRAAILAVGPEVSAVDLMLSPSTAVLPVATDSAAQESFDLDMKAVEKRHILDALQACGGVKKLAAERLGISERTLRYKLQRYREEDAGSA